MSSLKRKLRIYAMCHGFSELAQESANRLTELSKAIEKLNKSPQARTMVIKDTFSIHSSEYDCDKIDYRDLPQKRKHRNKTPYF